MELEVQRVQIDLILFRKAGVEGLGIVAMTLNEELLPFQEQILQALDGMKSDKV